jgi:hypothetical protein
MDESCINRYSPYRMIRQLRRKSLAVALLALPAFVFAQQQLGLRLERASGQYGAVLNPAQIAFMPHAWEVSLLQADVFFANRYGFLKNSSVFEALRRRDRIVVAGESPGENPPPADALVLDFYRTGGGLYAAGQARIAGPGVAFRFGESHVLGLTLAVRSGFSTYRVPEALRYDRLEDPEAFEAVDVPAFGAGLLAWGEVAVPYSRLFADGDVVWALGVTPKLLLGLEGAFARADAQFQYTPERGDTVAFADARWQYALTTGNAAVVEGNGAFRPRVNGLGAAVDLGVAWSMPAGDGDAETDYAWKLGVSLLDLGVIRFRREAERHALRFDTVIDVSSAQFPTDDLDALIAEGSRAFLGTAESSRQGRAFTAVLPTALSVQLDYRVRPSLYVGGVVVQRLPLGAFGLRRPNTLAVVPRFERRWWSVSVPVVLEEWRALRLGLAARLGYLTLGTDNLLSFVGQPRLTGSDFYVGLKIDGFSLGDGSRRRDGGGGMSRKSRRNIKCYDF